MQVKKNERLKIFIGILSFFLTCDDVAYNKRKHCFRQQNFNENNSYYFIFKEYFNSQLPENGFQKYPKMGSKSTRKWVHNYPKMGSGQ